MLTISSELFSIQADMEKVYMAAEISTLEGNVGQINVKEGFRIQSKRTGAIVTFQLTGIDTCSDDVAGWRFQPVAADLEKAVRPIEVLIIND